MIRAAATGMLLLLCSANAGRAQSDQDTTFYYSGAPRWSSHVAILGANTMLSALSGGVAQWLRGGSFQRGFTEGALGGGIIYVGKRVAGEQFDGAGLIGRQVAAVGSSVVRNAMDARPPFSRIMLPAGPIRLYVTTTGGFHVQPKLDLMTTAHIIYGVQESELRFDGRASLSAGAPVFKTYNKVLSDSHTDTHAGGLAASNVMYLSDVRAWGKPFLRRVEAHESVHIVQEDQLFMTFTDHIEDAVVDRLPFGTTINRWLDINLGTEVISVLLPPVFPRVRGRPWELEAIYLSR